MCVYCYECALLSPVALEIQYSRMVFGKRQGGRFRRRIFVCGTVRRFTTICKRLIGTRVPGPSSNPCAGPQNDDNNRAGVKNARWRARGANIVERETPWLWLKTAAPGTRARRPKQFLSQSRNYCVRGSDVCRRRVLWVTCASRWCDVKKKK